MFINLLQWQGHNWVKKSLQYSNGTIVPLLFFYKDGFDIKLPTKQKEPRDQTKMM